MPAVACQSFFHFIALWFLAVAAVAAPRQPEWIWHDNKGVAPGDTEVRFFRKTFNVPGPVAKAVLTASGDDQMAAFINGKQVAANEHWKKPVSVDVTKQIVSGDNLLAMRGRNSSGAAAIIARLDISLQGGKPQTVLSDTTWLSTEREVAGWEGPSLVVADWAKPISLGKLGVMPWGDVLKPPDATPAEQLTVLPGFKVELLHSATKEEGSWICMTVDPKGRLIISPQGDKQPLLRATINKQGKISSLEKIEQPVWTAMGLLHAFDSLYVSGNGEKGLGLYRLRDTDRDDKYDSLEFLRKFDGAAGEHGSHALVLGPDQKIYYIHGNFVKLPADLSPNSPHKNYAEDQLLPRQEDGNGFGVGNKPPGSFVVRMDKDAKNVELFAAGMRNAYDFDFNPDGEIFTFDSDMEWDWGTPWYRPVCIYHVVSGGDYGFREGTGKFPRYYSDSLPPVVDTGIGSPTGVKFGTGAKFPPKYQRALYAMDWSYGRILAAHLRPDGATYSGTFENFVVGKPLNVTDLEIGHDGAMYFMTGGRGTQSGLYRVSYTEPEVKEQLPVDQKAAEARALRRKLEAFHGRQDPKAVDFAWPHLNSDDRWIRYAARIAIESQPLEPWQNRALDEQNINASLTALLALARLGPRELQNNLLHSLARENLTPEQKLDVLRIGSLSFIRMGRPDSDTARDVVKALDPLYPSSSDRLNRELCTVLIYLEAPGVVKKTLDLLAKAPTQEEQLYYILRLRTAKSGWTMEDRKKYFSWFSRDRSQDQHPPETLQWFKDAGRDYGDGASFPKFMANIRKDAVANLTEAEREELASFISAPGVAAKPVVQRSIVKEWTMNDLVPTLDQMNKGRSFQKGKEAYALTQCLACHRFGNEGGSVGPDITGAASRFNRRDLLETIIEPSKVISDQYQNLTVTKKNGDDVTGRLVEETDQKVVLVVNPLTGDRAEVKKSEIAKRAPSKISPMPEGLVNVLTKEEILDLLAYIESGGKKDHAAFIAK